VSRRATIRCGFPSEVPRADALGIGPFALVALTADLLADSVKEVIQPQVPLRLPCYDFAPVTALAFGRLVPCGFRHGLRALTASMA
jgi:hypothetical protein